MPSVCFHHVVLSWLSSHHTKPSRQAQIVPHLWSHGVLCLIISQYLPHFLSGATLTLDCMPLEKKDSVSYLSCYLHHQVQCLTWYRNSITEYIVVELSFFILYVQDVQAKQRKGKLSISFSFGWWNCLSPPAVHPANSEGLPTPGSSSLGENSSHFLGICNVAFLQREGLVLTTCHRH